MSEAAPAAAAAPAAEAPKPKSGRKKLFIIIGAVALVEAVAIIGVMKFMGGAPQPSHGAEGEHVMEGGGHGDDGHGGGDGHGAAASQPSATEIKLLERFKVPNFKSGNTLIYDLDIAVLAGAGHKEAVEKLLTERKGALSDAVARIVRAADPRVLAEDDLRTLRMQLHHALNELAGHGEPIEQVLIPRCVPMRAD